MKRKLFITLGLLFTLPCAAFAQEAPATTFPQEDAAPARAPESGTEEEPMAQEVLTEGVKRNPDRSFISISHENDLLGGDTDQYYTSGVRLTYFNIDTKVPRILRGIDEYVPEFDLNAATATSFSIGQNLYTPQDIEIAENQEGDRPWAAFLYGSVGLSTVQGNTIDEAEITIGVVGPEALGEQSQKFVHRHISDSPMPKGWKNQIGFEPGLILSWQRRWPYAFHYDLPGDYVFRAEPNINVSLGNIYTYAGTGMMFTFGPGDALQDTPTRVRPAVPGSGYFETPPDGWSWYVFAGADGRAVARNIFLDGNTFKDSYSVDKEYFVGDLTGGLALTYEDYRISYSLNYRTEEFKTQPDPSIFGSVTLSTKF